MSVAGWRQCLCSSSQPSRPASSGPAVFFKRQVMRRTRTPEHPWYMLQCRLCRRHKHTLAFRRRRTRPGQIVVCKDCEQREPTGLPIPVSVHR